MSHRSKRHKSKKKDKPKKRPTTSVIERRNRREISFFYYYRKIMNRINLDDTKLSTSVKTAFDNIVEHFVATLTLWADALRTHRRSETMDSQDVVAAIHLLLGEELAKDMVGEIDKTLAMYKRSYEH